MHLLFFRHGIAAERESFALTGASDDERPLTSRGRLRTRLAAAGLSKLVSDVDLVASSPLVRARQTAEIVAEAFSHRAVAETAALRPSSHPRELLAWLSSRPERLGTAVVVGHEPHFSRTVSWLLSSSFRPLLEVKKASAVLLDVVGGHSTLIWALPPRALRGLADRARERSGRWRVHP